MFRNYLAAALRNLTRNGLYAGITIAGLAIAFAAAILIGLYVRDQLTFDRWIPGHERVFLLNERLTGINQPINSDATPEAVADLLKLDFPQIEYTARMTGQGFPPAIRRGDVIIGERNFEWVDPDFFKIMPMPAIAGDPRTALEAPDALVLSRTAARKYFGQDAPIGGVLTVDGHPMRIAAVIKDIPAASSLTGDVFGSSKAPFSAFAQYTGGGMLSNVGETYVRLRPGATAASVQGGLATFAQRRMLPDAHRYSPEVGIALRLKPLALVHLEPSDQGDAKPGVDPKVLGAIGVIGVLIIAVAVVNFITLMTARASRRAVEVGVRKALGARRRDLVIQFMGESFVYIAVALVFGVALTEIALPGLNGAMRSQIAFDYLGDPGLDAAILGVAVLAGLAAGVYPALVLSAFRPSVTLRGGPLEAAGGGRLRLVLVVMQFAVLVALLFATLTIYRQTMFALKGATHVNQDRVLLLFASPCTGALRDAVKAVSGVEGAACSSPQAINIFDSRDHMTINGRHVDIATAPVDFGFFEIYGVHPLAGRLFDPHRPADDGALHKDDAPPVVINESAARALGFASPQSALDHWVSWHFIAEYYAGLKGDPNRAPRPSQIVGVVPDFTLGSVRKPILPMLYFVGVKTNQLSSIALNVKLAPGSISQTIASIGRLWKVISHDQPLQQVFSDQFMLRLYIDTLIQGAFIAVCALIAISVACLGLFALSAYTAERRTKEIGVRKAMGAGSGDILRLLLWQFTRPVLLANLIAWPAAWLVMSWWLEGFAYRVDLAPWTFLVAGGVAVLIALGTVFVHALRVSRAKPVGALRYE